MNAIMKRAGFLLAAATLALSLTACDIEMPAMVYSEMPSSGHSSTVRSSSQVNTNLRLPANKISQSESTQLARTQGERFGVDTALVLGVITQESGFNANAVSSAGAMGLMQLMPSTVDHINDSSPVHIASAFNPQDNVAGGTWYLKSLYKQLSGIPDTQRWEFALASYNGGIGRVSRALDKISATTGKARAAITWSELKPYLPSETQNYVPAVMSHTDYYRARL